MKYDLLHEWSIEDQDAWDSLCNQLQFESGDNKEKLAAKIFSDITNFYSRSKAPKTTDFNYGPVRFYVRRSMGMAVSREIKSEPLVIANVVTDQVPGLFKRVMLKLEKWAKKNKVDIAFEQVLTPALATMLKKHGYKKVGGPNNNFIKTFK